MLVSEQQTEQSHDEQLPAELLQSDLSAEVATAEQPSSMGVVGLVSDSGNGAEVLELEMGRSKRAKIPPVRLQDYVINTVQKLNPSFVPTSSSHSSSTSYPILYSVNCDRFSIGHKKFLAAITTGSEPKFFKEAMQYPQWRDAMQKEISALEDNGT
ncbi:hypothetical protein LIER_27225 [Lithospermum erythrorhizon]|uniref:Uncharacterized protein n=1 Tax=Lithospermum erythrorhizon TaxID=34254 RepID=A0AAV3REJ1_LITER